MKLFFAVMLACGVIMGDSPAQAVISVRRPPPFPRWCQSRLDVLDIAERQAQYEYRSGQSVQALQTLETGLQEAASQIGNDYRRAITVNAILRGIDTLRILK